MAKLSKDERRSVACMTVSYFVHLVLIVMGSFVSLGLQERGNISLTVSASTSTDEIFFESPLDDFEAGLDAREGETFELDQQELEPEPLDEMLLQEELGLDLPVFEGHELPVGDRSGKDKSSSGGRSVAAGGRLRPKVNGVGFFGVEPSGQKVSFVIDMSISMERGYNSTRYERAVAEVLHAVSQLEEDQVFYVYLFCFRMYEMRIGPSGRFLPPTEDNVNRLADWLDSVQLGSGTDPRESLVAALKQKPHTLFLLSDGEFNGREHNNRPYPQRATAFELAERFNQVDCPIHTIGLEDRANQAVLTSIADASGGSYKFVPSEDPDAQLVGENR